MEPGGLIRVLGPIDVVRRGRVVPVGGRNARAVLGALVVGAGHAVPADQLRYAIWSGAAPLSADNSLQTYISRLRKLLGSDTIALTDHSYQLAVDPTQIDALVFEDLLVRAREVRADPPSCRQLCRGALALWRGEPFGDLVDGEFFRLEAMRLAELRLTAMELALESELALGRHDLAAAELESAVREHPYNEHLWHLLIEALVKDDRRIEAAAACAELRAVLKDAGIRPGDRLRHLEHVLVDGHAIDGIMASGDGAVSGAADR